MDHSELNPYQSPLGFHEEVLEEPVQKPSRLLELPGQYLKEFLVLAAFLLLATFAVLLANWLLAAS